MQILKLLKESQGNILDDEQLINTLNHSKLTSSVIAVRHLVTWLSFYCRPYPLSAPALLQLPCVLHR